MPKEKGSIKFGVYQKKTGSYTLGEDRFPPVTAVSVSEDTVKLACSETSPVVFFDTKEDADAAVAKLKAKFFPPKVKPEDAK